MQKAPHELIFVMTGACATPGGIAAANRNILPVLADLTAERNVRLTVLSFLEGDADRPESLPDATTFRGFRGNKVRLGFALLRYGLTRPLFVFDHVTLAKPLLPLIATRWIRPVVFAHGSESWKRIRPVNRWLFAKAILVLTNSQFTLKKMRERIPRFTGAACPLGLAPEFELKATPAGTFRESLSFQNVKGETRALASRVCLLVGRMDPREREKGHDELLAVWPEIVREFPETQLVFAGSGEDRERLARVACEGGVGDSVFVLAAVGHDTLLKLYATCYAFTMPSRQEGFGLVFLEAMNAAKPCLGCRDGGAEDVIVDGETGLLIDNPIDSGDLIAALQRLLRDPAAAREMGRRGFYRLHAKFTAAHVQQRIYEQLAKVV